MKYLLAALLSLSCCWVALPQLSPGNPFFVAGVLKPAAAGGGSIAIDLATCPTYSVNVSSKTYSHTCTGSGLALFVGVGWYDAVDAVTITSVTYNGVTMTELWDAEESTYGLYGSAGFVLAAPATGAHDVVITLSGNTEIVTSACSSWTGVNQSTPSRGVFTSSFLDESAPYEAAITVTDAQSGDVVVDFVACNNTTLTANQTQRCLTSGVEGVTSYAHQSAAATGSTVMSYSMSGVTYGYLGAVALRP